jgi:phage terminase large subunit
VRREFHENPGQRNKVYHASTLENKKFLPAEYVTELTTRYPKEWVDRFVNGSWDTMLGQIYKELDLERIHAIPPFDIPAHWKRFIALDFGIVNPTAVLWVAVDEHGNAYAYQEYYQAGKTLEEHAQAIKRLCAQDGHTPVTDDNKILIYADPSIKADYDPHGKSTWEHFNDKGIFCRAANNAVLDGIQNMQSFIHPQADRAFPSQHPRAGERGAPRLYIFDSACPWLCRELKAYEWEPTKEGQNAPEKPRKYMDHEADCLRYLCASIRDAVSGPAPLPNAEEIERKKAEFDWIYTPAGDEGDE